MAWIESHAELPQHPKTRRLARRLDASIPQVVGHLHCLWWWCLTYAPDGRLDGLDAVDVADAALWDGDPELFVKALLDCGWLDDDDGAWAVHDWWDAAGKTVARRRDAAERQRRRRAEPTSPSPDGSPDSSEAERDDSQGHAPVTRDSDEQPRESRDGHGGNRNRNRNRNRDTPRAPAREAADAPGDAEASPPLALVADTSDPPGPDPVEASFEDFWRRYPRHAVNGKPGGGGARKTAWQRWRRMSSTARDRALAAVDHYRAWCESPAGEYPAHAATWLHQERWEQWQEPAVPPDTRRGDLGRNPDGTRRAVM